MYFCFFCVSSNPFWKSPFPDLGIFKMILKNSGKRQQWRHSFGIFMTLHTNIKQRHKTNEHLQPNKVTQYPYKSQPPKAEIHRAWAAVEEQTEEKHRVLLWAIVATSSRCTSGNSAGPAISSHHNHRWALQALSNSWLMQREHVRRDCAGVIGTVDSWNEPH